MSIKQALFLLVVAPLTIQQTTPPFTPAPGNFPATGDDAFAGGIFSIPLSDLGPYLAGAGATGSESPTVTGQVTSGSGPYPAQMLTDTALQNHTIYAPKSPPKNISMPFIAFGNGACMKNGATYRNFLTEIASHGYVVVADGKPGDSTSVQSTLGDMRASIAFAADGRAAKYGEVDTERILTMGHSCGGLEAMSVAYHNDKAKQIVMLDIAIFQDNRRYLLSEIKVPVAWFVGGPKDMGYPNALKDYQMLNAGLPAYQASLDTGHGGTYSATNGGKFGKAVVAYLEWTLRGNATAKALCLTPSSPGSLVSDHWNVTYKNWS